jgi:hypothetical protein
VRFASNVVEAEDICQRRSRKQEGIVCIAWLKELNGKTGDKPYAKNGIGA